MDFFQKHFLEKIHPVTFGCEKGGIPIFKIGRKDSIFERFSIKNLAVWLEIPTASLRGSHSAPSWNQFVFRADRLHCNYVHPPHYQAAKLGAGKDEFCSSSNHTVCVNQAVMHDSCIFLGG